jgi:transcriptional regulator with XRE-family HTH domain
MNSQLNRRPTPADIRFGQRMRARRTMLGLSQTELAEALDVTFRQIQSDGRTNQRDDSVADLTAFLATSEGIALCSAFRQIESEGMRNAVINFLQGLTTKHERLRFASSV